VSVRRGSVRAANSSLSESPSPSVSGTSGSLDTWRVTGAPTPSSSTRISQPSSSTEFASWSPSVSSASTVTGSTCIPTPVATTIWVV